MHGKHGKIVLTELVFVATLVFIPLCLALVASHCVFQFQLAAKKERKESMAAAAALVSTFGLLNL